METMDMKVVIKKDDNNNFLVFKQANKKEELMAVCSDKQKAEIILNSLCAYLGKNL